MNERIKELRRIAQNEVCFQAYEENNRKWTTEEVDVKFAELIVEECIKTIPIDIDPAVYLKVLRAIDGRFGVE